MALRHTVGDLASTLASMLRTRLELFALEAGGQRDLLLRALIKSLVGVLLLVLALITLSLTIALAFWPTPYRYHAMVLMVLVYAGAGGAVLWSVRQALVTAVPPFSATLEELRNDLEMLDRLRQRDDDDEGDDEEDGNAEPAWRANSRGRS